MFDWIVQFYYLKQGQRGSWSIPAVEPRFHLEKDWIHAFEACYQSGESIEEFETRVASSKSSSSFRRSPTVERE